jgi:hypothetical protein
MKGGACVLSVAEHAGWAHVIFVGVLDKQPAVVARRRITLIDSGLPTQPYHHEASAMTDADANALIARVRRSIATRTSEALQRVLGEVAADSTVVAVAIRKPPFDDLPETYPPVRESYRLFCAADGMMYQLAICDAARRLALDVQMCPRGEEASRAAKQLGVRPRDIETFVTRTRPSGPPWTEEHRRAYAAGIAVLAAHVPLLKLQNGRIAELRKGQKGKSRIV